MFKVICLFICVASTFKNSFWGETLQLLPMFKVIFPFIWAATTFKKSLGGETLQLLPMFKVICLFICVASTFKNSFWGEHKFKLVASTVGSKDEAETLWMFIVHQIIFF
jgi:hypothetical protein